MTNTITLPRSVIEQALDALQDADTRMEHRQDVELRHSAMAALRAALEQPQLGQEPVAWIHQNSNTDKEYLVWCKSEMGGRNWRPLYLHPQPPRQPLSDEQILKLGWAVTPYANQMEMLSIARAIERAHGIKGEA